MPRRVAEIDWTSWTAVDPATLCFVLEHDQVLLIRKKRGLGAGKINAPGGRVEPGESFSDGAVREMREEVGVEPVDPRELGRLRFQFLDGYSIDVHVFRALARRGEPRETEEAIPLWFGRDALPYDEMWADDRLWVPHLLAGRRFDGRFVFDGDSMLDSDLDVDET